MLNPADTHQQWQTLHQGLAAYQERWLTGASCQSLPPLLAGEADPNNPYERQSQALAVSSQLPLFSQAKPSHNRRSPLFRHCQNWLCL